MKKLLTLTVAITLICGQMLSGSRVVAQGQTLNVVATFSILADLVANVGGDAVEVDALVPANADAHSFEPSPEQVASLTGAAIIFENGVGFESWLEGMVDAANPDAPVADVSEGIELRSAAEHHDEEDGHEADEDHGDEEAGHQENDEDGHDHGDFDPHIWQSVPNAIVIVDNIKTALISADPDNEAVYESNSASYIAELEELDSWIIEQVATLAEDRRKLVTSHDTFGYFADQYGFEVIGTPLGVSTETSEPSARDIAALIELIADAGVSAVFSENVQNDSLIEQIANDAGVTLAPPLFTDALGDEESGASSYIGMMRFNTDTIVEALSG